MHFEAVVFLHCFLLLDPLKTLDPLEALDLYSGRGLAGTAALENPKIRP